MARMRVKTTYTYEFQSSQLQPILETEFLLEEDDVLRAFGKQEVLTEKPMKESRKKDVAVSLAEAQGRIVAITEPTQTKSAPAEKEQHQLRSYTLAYFNPETQQTEVFAARVDVRIPDPVRQIVEEASGTASAYTLYSFIASPLVTTQMDPQLLQRILDAREYGTPPPFGGAAVVRIGTPSRALASVHAEKTQSAIVEAWHRKERVESKIKQEIILLQQAAEALGKEKPETALARLGPLTRARFLLAIRQKNLSPKTILLLLERDVRFLEAVKKKLQRIDTPGLLELIRAMKELKR